MNEQVSTKELVLGPVHGRVITLATARVLGGVAARAPSSSPCEHSTIHKIRLQARQLPLSSLDSQIYSEICNPKNGHPHQHHHINESARHKQPL